MPVIETRNTVNKKDLIAQDLDCYESFVICDIYGFWTSKQCSETTTWIAFYVL